MDETYGTYVDDECFDIHDYDDDTDHDADGDTDDHTDDDTTDDTDDDTDDGGRTCILSNFLAAVPGSLVFGSWSLVLGLRSLVLGPWTLVFEFHAIQ